MDKKKREILEVVHMATSVLMLVLMIMMVVSFILKSFNSNQQAEIDRLNEKLTEARQEIADKTNRIYELNLELEGRK